MSKYVEPSFFMPKNICLKQMKYKLAHKTSMDKIYLNDYPEEQKCNLYYQLY
jgi:hypothetical protein